MEDKRISEKESLELIARMIRETQDLARQLKAAFTSEIDARHYASLMRNVSVMAGYKDTYVVKKSDIDVSRV